MPISLVEPVLTWNFCLTIILVPGSMALGIWKLQRILTKREEVREAKKAQSEQEIEKLTAEKEVLKLNEVKEWRSQIYAKLHEVKESVDVLADRVNKANGRTYKLEKEIAIHKQHCVDEHQQIYMHSRKDDTRIPLV